MHSKPTVSVPVPASSHNREPVPFGRPRHPFLDPIVIPRVELTGDLAPVQMGTTRVTVGEPMSILLTVQTPDWTWEDGARPWMGQKVIVTDSRGVESRIGTNPLVDPLREHKSLHVLWEFDGDLDPGEYSIHIIHRHQGYEKPIPLDGVRRTEEEFEAAIMESIIAEGTLVVE